MKYENLPGWSIKVLKSLMDVVTPTKIKLDYDYKEVILKQIDDFLFYLPWIMKVGLLFGLFLFNFAALFYLKKPFTACKKYKFKMNYYLRWAESPVYLFRTMVKGIKVLILITYFSLRELWEYLDYHPEEWHKERTGEYPSYYLEEEHREVVNE